MTPKEKAQELVEKFKYHVHGYIGSSMLSNTEYPEQILSNAKKVSIIAVNEIIDATNTLGFKDLEYWQQVKKELENI